MKGFVANLKIAEQYVVPVLIDGVAGCNFPEELEPLAEFIMDLLNIMVVGAAVLALFMLAWAGLEYMIGETDKIEQAKRRIKAVFIGLTIVLFSAPVVYVFINHIGACEWFL